MTRKKITVVGVGNVGATTAHLLALKELGNVVLVDIVEGLPQGKALDINESGPVSGFDCKVIGTNSYGETKDSDIVVITAGVPRKEGMSRDDLIKINAKIVKSVTSEVVKYSPNSIIIVVSNPLDAMVYVASKVSGFSKNRIMGMAGVLDSTRFKSFVAEELKVSVKKIDAFVLGGHGDSMVPMTRYAKVDGKLLSELMPKEKIDAIVERTRKGGGEFLPLLKTSAWVAPAASIVEMVEAIIKDKKKILPCAAYLDGEYGVKGLFIGVLVKLGAGGVEEVVEIELNDSEKELFGKTVEHVKSLVEATDGLLK